MKVENINNNFFTMNSAKWIMEERENTSRLDNKKVQNRS